MDNPLGEVKTEEKQKKKKPTNKEIMETIEQPIEKELKEVRLNKTNEHIIVNDIVIDLYTSDKLIDYYININDYCKVFPSEVKDNGEIKCIKADGGKFLTSKIKYPAAVLAYGYSGDDRKDVMTMFINIHGCEIMKSCSSYLKYKDFKNDIYDTFFSFLKSLKQQSANAEIPVISVTKETKDFQMFDNTSELNEETSSSEETSELNEETSEVENTTDVSYIFDNIVQELDALKNSIEKLQLEKEELEKENNTLKTKSYTPIDEGKLQALYAFSTELHNTTKPFANKYILDILTVILDKAVQVHIGQGANKNCFIKDFNAYTNRSTMYKDQVKDFDNEPFVRIAMRIYGYEVIDFALNTKYKDSVLYQFKNMFGINITNNKYVLNEILGLLKRTIVPTLDKDAKVDSSISFKMGDA
jgi:hypothetical protein